MKKALVKIFITILGLFWISLSGFSQHKTYLTKPIKDKPPKIDGILDDASWNLVEWQGDFTERFPYSGKNPSQQTQFKILYDDNNLYVGVRLFDDKPDKIESRLTKRDQFDGDHINVIFDSYNDDLTAFAFGVNAAGVQSDQMISNDKAKFDRSWDAVYSVKTSIDDLGWVAEFQIPLSQLRFAKVDEYIWGLQLFRVFYRGQEFSTWQFIPFESTAWVSGFGDLKGISGIEPRLAREIIPYTVGKIEHYKKEIENPYETGRDNDLSFGLDGKFGVSNDMTLNFTFNPDFGQVEADPSEVNLTAFETFFPEKRPFFVEGNNIFDYRVNDGDGPVPALLFYSRRIGRQPQLSYDEEDKEYVRNPEFTNIIGAVKLSGKTRNGLSVGVLESVTSEMNADISLNGNKRRRIVEPLTNYFVARIQKDYNGGNTVFGSILTSVNRQYSKSAMNELAKNAFSGGLDFIHFWKNKTYSISAKLFFSHINGTRAAITELQESSQRYFQRPDLDHLNLDTTRTSLTGMGGLVHFRKEGNGNFRYGAVINFKSPELDFNDIGYIKDVDRITQTNYVMYQVFKPGKIFRNLNFMFFEWNLFDFGGTLFDQGIFSRNEFHFLNNWSFELELVRQLKSLSRTELRGGPAMLHPNSTQFDLFLRSDPSKKFKFDFRANYFIGDKNFSNIDTYRLGLHYQATNAFSFSLEPNFLKTRNDVKFVDDVDFSNEKRYLIGTIDRKQLGFAFRMNMSLSPNFTIQYYGQPFIFAKKYSNFKRVTDAVAENYNDRFHQFSANEISYNASTDYYLVDENGDGSGIDYEFENPNSNVFEFLSNLVVRWEYSPGSTLYFVWSQTRSEDNSMGRYDFKENMTSLFDIYPRNIFLIKFSYRFVL